MNDRDQRGVVRAGIGHGLLDRRLRGRRHCAERVGDCDGNGVVAINELIILDRALTQHGRLHYLFNNAGINVVG